MPDLLVPPDLTTLMCDLGPAPGSDGGSAGRLYVDLSDDHKSTFLNYGLSFDLITAASESEVREVFRRMNLYTVPLNPEGSPPPEIV